MSLHDTFKSTTLGNTNSIDVIAGSKQIGADLLAGFHFLGEISKFADSFDGDAVEFFDMTEQRFCEAMLLLIIKPELNGVIAIGCLRLALEHAIGTGQDNSNRGDDALGVVNARLAELFS